MSNKVVLLDLEKNMPNAQLLRDIIQHYAVIYLFNCQGKFEYSLEDLTEFSGWVSSGQVVILETAEVDHKEFEYAVVVGQLIALLEPDTTIEVISAMPSSEILLEMMQSSDMNCHLIQIQAEKSCLNSKYKIPSVETIKQKPDLLLIKKYCDALAKMKGKPNSIEKLKNSISNILQVESDQAQQLIALLINLKIVKRYDEQINFRKKLLKQWTELDLEQATPSETAHNISPIFAQLQTESSSDEELEHSNTIHHAQKDLFKNFSKIDPVQVIVARKLRELKSDKPKDIYALRDLLEQMFPKSDVRLLLKELIEKGYIYWNGSEVLYSHEMFLN
ncbi:hypothetical protein [Acinetobacter terrae]|jgi:hypothetical protein|uniref:PIN-like domain-containing protein n=1 Tax=Acinetobacter terrae TaxID=2731247 RepID=A0A4R0EJ83_9GAMM|nr:hypothetical protein [Acinetobacter terrae]NNH14560.1 hypothetical protein [Acinetobacter terrae]OAL88353.1 hypothetical protein AY608_00755 [Acinetobacter terrae]TCB57142.1 hypothetical protein E0H85_13155 [Acinetobacter terrae]